MAVCHLKKSLLTTAALLVGFNLINGPLEAEEKRQLSAHVHGIAKLELAIEGKDVAMTMNIPGMDTVGFETAADTDEKKAKVAKAKATLGDAIKLFGVPEAAGCSVKQKDIDYTALTGGHDDHDHDKDKHNRKKDAHDDHDHKSDKKDDHDHKKDDHSQIQYMDGIQLAAEHAHDLADKVKEKATEKAKEAVEQAKDAATEKAKEAVAPKKEQTEQAKDLEKKADDHKDSHDHDHEDAKKDAPKEKAAEAKDHDHDHDDHEKPKEKAKDEKHDHDHDDHDKKSETESHYEFKAEYRLNCANIAKLDRLNVNLFKSFPELKTLDVTGISDKGQLADKLSAKAYVLDLSRLH